MSKKNTPNESTTLLRRHLNKRANSSRGVQIREKTMNKKKDNRVALELADYNEMLAMYALKHGDEAEAIVSAKYRVKGVKGGIAELFKKEMPEHVFARAIATHGSTQQEFTCSESGQKYVIRINGAKVVN